MGFFQSRKVSVIVLLDFSLDKAQGILGISKGQRLRGLKIGNNPKAMMHKR